MASHAGFSPSRRAESNNGNIILIVATIVGVVALLALIVLVFIIVRRKRRNARQTLYPPPIAPHKLTPDMSASSSLLQESSDRYQPSPYPLSSHKRPGSNTNVRSSLLQDATNGWDHPSPYPQPSHRRTTSDVNAKPSLHEMNNEWGYSNPYLSHSRVSSDSSSRPLLRGMNNDYVHVERPVPIHRTTEGILLNNPTGQYRVPVSRPTSRGSDHTPTGSSFCLRRTDITPSSDNPYLTRLSVPHELPPLIVPQETNDWFIPPQMPSTVAEESALSQSFASCASSASSTYSQSTVHSPSHPTDLPVPQNGIASPELEPKEGLARGNTAFVGTLLKARAERNPGGLVHGTSVISHIERTGSIKSVCRSDKPYAQRYRAKVGSN